MENICKLKAKALGLGEIDLDKTLLIDIRNEEKFASFHVAGSINIPRVLGCEERLLSLALGEPKSLALLCFSSKHAKDLAFKVEAFSRKKSLFKAKGLDLFSNTEAKRSDLAKTPQEKSIYFVDEAITAASSYGLKMIVPNESLKDKIKETKAKLKRAYLSTQGAFQVAFSGGKDSTCVLQIFLEMLGELDAKQRRQSYVVATDTLVENPKIAEFLKSVIDSINKSKLCKKLKVKAMINQPEVQNRFFSLLIGKGYPSPTRTFRWCYLKYF